MRITKPYNSWNIILEPIKTKKYCGLGIKNGRIEIVLNNKTFIVNF